MKPIFLDRLRGGDLLVADGSTGVTLQSRGLERGKAGEAWVLERPEEIIRLHRDFIASGSDIILTCTFGATSYHLDKGPLAGKVEEINRKAVQLAKEAIGDLPVYIGGSMGPLGQLIKPLGTLTVEEAYEAYLQQARALVEGGVDLLLVETQFDISEASAAVRAAKAAGKLPVICSFSYDRGVRTMMGVSPTKMAEAIAPLGVDALGINCGRSLEDNLKALKELKGVTTLPVWFKPNAGLPQLDAGGNTTYSVTPEAMGAQAVEWLAAGAQVVGGCCGTSPEHLRAIAKAVKPA
jgi:5-methyltetrahydrofolate--homocysteine methyltransferase